MDRWRGKVAVVTGAANGIGAGIVKSLIEEGINVVGLDVEVEKLEKQSDDYRKSGNAVLYPIKCDVTNQQDMNRAFDFIENQLGGVHVMVNNVGVTDYTPIIESERSTFERLININVIAAATCIAKAVQSMRANKVEGHIFNINSVLGHLVPEGSISEVDGVNGWNLYPASKHANLAMTQTVRREISRAGAPIRITSISPGLVKTEISKNVETLKDFYDKVPALNPSDIADVLIYALGAPPQVQITEITVRTTGELV